MVLRQVVSIGLGEGVANAKDGARHLTPEEWHAALVNRGGDGKSVGSASGAEPEVVLLDARNLYESRIGRCRPLTFLCSRIIFLCQQERLKGSMALADSMRLGL